MNRTHTPWTFCACLTVGFLLARPAPAATVSTGGSINCFQNQSGVFCTLDYVMFAAVGPETLTISASRLIGVTSLFFRIYSIIAPNEFAHFSSPSILLNTRNQISTVTVNVISGNYALIAQPFDSEWEVEDGFQPFFSVDAESLSVVTDYQIEIAGDIVPDRLLEGNPDGTFTVTIIPEPGVALLAALGGGLMLRRRRNGRWVFPAHTLPHRRP